MIKYTGNVMLKYWIYTDKGTAIPTGIYVMAFHSTAKELKDNFVPWLSPGKVILELGSNTKKEY